jgi:hypothetical protein
VSGHISKRKTFCEACLDREPYCPDTCMKCLLCLQECPDILQNRDLLEVASAGLSEHVEE